MAIISNKSLKNCNHNNNKNDTKTVPWIDTAVIKSYLQMTSGTRVDNPMKNRFSKHKSHRTQGAIYIRPL